MFKLPSFRIAQTTILAVFLAAHSFAAHAAADEVVASSNAVVPPPTDTRTGKRPVQVRIEDFPDGFPYRALDTTDSIGRTVRFYLTDANVSDDRPLILVIQGSGCSSNFFQRDAKVSRGWHEFARRAAEGRAQILIVEKPGVKLFDRPQNPGSAVDCSAEFKHEQTRDRWLAALRAALVAAIELRGAYSPRAVMAIGHSEGAVFAPLVAIAEPRVTHTALLSASPLSQLHDFFDMAASGQGFIAKSPGGKPEHIKRTLDAWKQVSGDPQSEGKNVFGHPHRYWNDKFAPFDWAQLEKTRAKIFIAHGDADENSSVRTTDYFAIELIVRRRDLTWLRKPGADHSFSIKDVPSPAGGGMPVVVGHAVAWFLGDAFDRTDIVWPQ